VSWRLEWSFFNRDMFSKLVLGFSFDYWPEERPAFLFFIETLSIMVVHVFVTYYVLAWIDVKTSKKIQISPNIINVNNLRKEQTDQRQK
jgi:hypothetical protein